MKLIKGDLWKSDAPIKLFTGNSYITKAGALVMGRGAALQAKEKWPELPYILGRQITHLSKYGIAWADSLNVGVFQVKYNFKDDADLELITYSTNKLLEGLSDYEWVKKETGVWVEPLKYAMNFPGIGWGHLQNKRDEILKIISVLPDNVEIHEV